MRSFTQRSSRGRGRSGKHLLAFVLGNRQINLSLSLVPFPTPKARPPRPLVGSPRVAAAATDGRRRRQRRFLVRLCRPRPRPRTYSSRCGDRGRREVRASVAIIPSSLLNGLKLNVPCYSVTSSLVFVPGLHATPRVHGAVRGGVGGNTCVYCTVDSRGVFS